MNVVHLLHLAEIFLVKELSSSLTWRSIRVCEPIWY